MKNIASLGLLVLVATMMIMGGMTSHAAAQTDPTILLRIAQNAQAQIGNNIPDSSSDEIQKLFQEGSDHVDALSKALENEDTNSAKKHFLAAMKIFKEISHMLTQNNVPKAEVAVSKAQTNNPTSDLLKLYRYASSLKAVAEKYQAAINFTQLDNLFGTAREQISSKQFNDAQETIHKINQVVDDIEKQLRDQASQQEYERAQRYAQQYVEQLDRLIENAKNQEVSDDIIKQLEDARERLSSASSPEEIVKEIRNIISIKNQFELTKNDQLESRIMQAEKILMRLSQMAQVDPQIIKDSNENLKTIKLLLSEGEFEKANDLLKSLMAQLNEIQSAP